MANPTLSNSSGLPWFLEAATFFSDKKNVGKKFQDVWTYPQTEQLLNEIARGLGISIENPNFDQVVDFLFKLFEKQEDLLESRIPPTLKVLLEEYEKDKEKASLLRQQEAAKIEAWLAAKERSAKHSETIRRISASIAKKLSESPLPPSLASEVAEKVVPNIEIEPEVLLEIQKAEQLPESEKTSRQAQIEQRLQQTWEEAIEKTGQELPQATKLTQEQIDYLNRHRPPTLVLTSLAASSQSRNEREVFVGKVIAETFSGEHFAPQQAEEIVIRVVERVEIQPSIGIALQETASLPDSPEKTKQLEEIKTSLYKSWEKAVDQTVRSFQQTDKPLNAEQIDYLKAHQPEPIVLTSLSVGTEINKQTAVALIKERLTPVLPPQQATLFVQTIENSLIDTLPKISLTLGKFDNLSPEQKETVLREVKEQFEQAVVVAVSENYQPLAGQITLTPSKTTQLLETIAPSTAEEFKSILPLLQISPEERLMAASINSSAPLLKGEISPEKPIPASKQVIFASPPSLDTLPLVTEQVTSLPTTAQTPPLFGLRKQILSVGPSQLPQLSEVDKPGSTVFDRLKERLEKGGINPQGNSFIQATLSEQQAFMLTVFGLKPEDIEHTIGLLKSKGVSLDSPIIKELQAAKENLSRFQLTNKIPKEEVLFWQRLREKEKTQGKPSLTLPFSRFKTPILETTSYTPKTRGFLGTQGIVRKILGEKTFTRFFGEKAIIFKKQILLINKIDLFKARVSNKVATWFFKTGIGKSVKVGIQKVGLKTLQGFWLAAKTGAKKAIVKGATAVATKLGLHAVLQFFGSFAPVVGNAIAFVAGIIIEKGFKAIISFFKKGGGAFSAITKGVLGGLTQFEYGKSDNQMLSTAFLIPLVIIAVFMTLLGGGSFGAFVAPGLGSGMPGGIEINPECGATRHLAEETICKLSRNPTPCNNSIINTSTWPQVEQCFNQISLTGKDSIQSTFEGSVQRNGDLQCVGFAVGIKNAEGRNLVILAAARDYLSVSVPGYFPTTSGKPEPNVGDLFVWRGGTYGHIAIFIAKDGETKIIVAEADGYSGRIALVAYPYSALGAGDGSPDGLLQPN